MATGERYHFRLGEFKCTAIRNAVMAYPIDIGSDRSTWQWHRTLWFSAPTYPFRAWGASFNKTTN